MEKTTEHSESWLRDLFGSPPWLPSSILLHQYQVLPRKNIYFFERATNFCKIRRWKCRIRSPHLFVVRLPCGWGPARDMGGNGVWSERSERLESLRSFWFFLGRVALGEMVCVGRWTLWLPEVDACSANAMHKGWCHPQRCCMLSNVASPHGNFHVEVLMVRPQADTSGLTVFFRASKVAVNDYRTHSQRFGANTFQRNCWDNDGSVFVLGRHVFGCAMVFRRARDGLASGGQRRLFSPKFAVAASRLAPSDVLRLH